MWIWSVARYDLGLSEQDTGKLTLLEFDALLKRHQAARNDARLNAGIIAAAVYNCAPGDPHRKPSNPYDFVPGSKPPESETDIRELDPEKQRDYFMSAFGPLMDKNKKE